MTVETLFIIAAVFLALELIVVSMGALGFIAFGCFLYALFIMHQTGIETFYGLSFEAIAAIGLSIFTLFAVGGYFAYKSFRKKISVGIESMTGEPAVVTQWKGNHGKIEYEGEDWRAASTHTFKIGDICTITGYKNMTLTVEKGQ
jgi:membrane-bound ClpP family serine protease